MNYLAHLYLSGEDDEVLIGNYIADSVKGPDLDKYSEGIQKGIRLHRAIDSYTDQHPVVLKSKKRLRPKYRKFSGIVVDVFYDHFLAVNWESYHHQSLRKFTSGIYVFLAKKQGKLTPHARRFLAYMVSRDILYKYAKLEGVNIALTGLSRRARFRSGMEHAVNDLEEGYDLFAREFDEFFPDLQAFTASKLLDIQTDRIKD